MHRVAHATDGLFHPGRDCDLFLFCSLKVHRDRLRLLHHASRPVCSPCRFLSASSGENVGIDKQFRLQRCSIGHQLPLYDRFDRESAGATPPVVRAGNYLQRGQQRTLATGDRCATVGGHGHYQQGDCGQVEHQPQHGTLPPKKHHLQIGHQDSLRPHFLCHHERHHCRQ